MHFRVLRRSRWRALVQVSFVVLAAGTAVIGLARTATSDTLAATGQPAAATHDQSIAPPPPSGLAWTGLAADHVALAWSRARPEEAVSSYVVLRDGKQIAEVEGTAYDDRSVVPGTRYLYSVAAVDAQGRVSAPTPALQVTSLSGNWATFAGAGDIATGGDGDEKTATLLDELVARDPSAIVFALGDNVYPDGKPDPFGRYYEKSWGRHKQRTRPVVGNHDYELDKGQAYFDYFGASAGPAGKGYYSYDLGDWHIVALNSNIAMQAGSEQEAWLRSDLAANDKDCILAYAHEPLFSSGKVHGGNKLMKPLWHVLREYGADVMLSGNEHNYERFAPQMAQGIADPDFGMRQFVVGTGGIGHYAFVAPVGNSEKRNAENLGILKLTLRPGRYDWEFVSTDGAPVDSGTGTCSKGRPVEKLASSSIASGADDVLEGVASREIYATSSGEYMGRYRDGKEQLLALRFTGLAIPPGSRIKSAYIQFKARDTSREEVTLTLSGEADARSAGFSSAPGDVSLRKTTAARVVWTPEPWTEGEVSYKQRTPSLAAIVQELVNLPGWAPDSALTFIVSGTGPGNRVARSYEYYPGDQPELVVEYGPLKLGTLP